MNHHEVQITRKRAPWRLLLSSPLLGISREELAAQSTVNSTAPLMRED